VQPENAKPTASGAIRLKLDICKADASLREALCSVSEWWQISAAPASDRNSASLVDVGPPHLCATDGRPPAAVTFSILESVITVPSRSFANAASFSTAAVIRGLRNAACFRGSVIRGRRIA
jgi:hypothetical protein